MFSCERELDVFYAGQPDHKFEVESFDNCEKACLDDSACVTFFQIASQCNIFYDDLGQRVAIPGAQSGHCFKESLEPTRFPSVFPSRSPSCKTVTF